MKLSTKLTTGFGSLMAIAAVLGAASYYSSNRNARSIGFLAAEELPAVQALLTMKDAGNTIKACQRTLLSFDLDPAIRLRQTATTAKAREQFAAAARTFDALPRKSTLAPMQPRC